MTEDEAYDIFQEVQGEYGMREGDEVFALGLLLQIAMHPELGNNGIKEACEMFISEREIKTLELVSSLIEKSPDL